MNQHSKGFIKLQRSETTDELLTDRIAFHLLSIIAYRARFTEAPSLHGLKFGQALIGDYEEFGMTRSEARCAQNRLTKWGLATFRGKRRGTIATLCDNRVFSLRNELEGKKNSHHNSQLISEVKPETAATRTANDQPSDSHQTATNQKGRREERVRRGEDPPPQLPISLPESEAQAASEALKLAPALVAQLFSDFRAHKLAYPQDWKGLSLSELRGYFVHWVETSKHGQEQMTRLQPPLAKDYTRL